MSRVRAVVTAVSSAVAVLGLCAAAVWAGHVLPPDPAGPVEEAAVPVVANDSSFVCPGTVQESERGGVAGGTGFEPLSADTRTRLQAVRVDGPRAGQGILSTLSGNRVAELIPGVRAATLGEGRSVRNPTVLTAGPAADGVIGAAASVSSLTTQGDLRGLAAASCLVPGVSHWLVGGSTQLGSSTSLVLQNPGQTPALVSIEMWGPSGPVAPAAPVQFTVAPGAEVVTLLEGVAAEQRRVVVRATSSGALVTAFLQHGSLDGLRPTGVDLVVPGAAPAVRQVLPAIVVEPSEVDSAHAAFVRMLAPESDAQVTVTVLGADGQVILRGAERLGLRGGEVTDVGLGGLPAGAYTVVLDADRAIVAGAQVVRTGTAGDPAVLGYAQAPVDVAWIASAQTTAPAESEEGREEADVAGWQVAVPPETSAQLVLAAVPTGVRELRESAATDPAADSPAVSGTVHVVDVDGGVVEQAVTLRPGRTLSVDLSAVLAGRAVAGVAWRPAPSPADRVQVVGAVVVEGAVPPSADGETQLAPGLVSALVPVVALEGQDEVRVRRDRGVGLPR